MRLGLIGLASSHVDQILRLTREGALGDVRVTALAVPDAEPVDEARAAALTRTVEDDGRAPGAAPHPDVLSGDGAAVAAALAGRVDAALVTTRDARTHRALADPLLRAGVPVLVDKPFTADLDDAEHLVRLAADRAVPLASWSALRWHPAVRAAAERWRAEPGGLAVSATGPADPDGPHGGLGFYAVHAVEVLLAVLRDRPVGQVATASAAGVRVGMLGAGRDVGTVSLVTPARGEQTPFHLAVAGPDGRTDHTLDLGPDYLLPGLRAFTAGLAAGTMPVDGRELVTAVRVVAALS